MMQHARRRINNIQDFNPFRSRSQQRTAEGRRVLLGDSSRHQGNNHDRTVAYFLLEWNAANQALCYCKARTMMICSWIDEGECDDDVSLGISSTDAPKPGAFVV